MIPRACARAKRSSARHELFRPRNFSRVNKLFIKIHTRFIAYAPQFLISFFSFSFHISHLLATHAHTVAQCVAWCRRMHTAVHAGTARDPIRMRILVSSPLGGEQTRLSSRADKARAAVFTRQTFVVFRLCINCSILRDVAVIKVEWRARVGHGKATEDHREPR